MRFVFLTHSYVCFILFWACNSSLTASDSIPCFSPPSPINHLFSTFSVTASPPLFTLHSARAVQHSPALTSADLRSAHPGTRHPVQPHHPRPLLLPPLLRVFSRPNYWAPKYPNYLLHHQTMCPPDTARWSRLTFVARLSEFEFPPQTTPSSIIGRAYPALDHHTSLFCSHFLFFLPGLVHGRCVRSRFGRFACKSTFVCSVLTLTLSNSFPFQVWPMSRSLFPRCHTYCFPMLDKLSHHCPLLDVLSENNISVPR